MLLAQAGSKTAEEIAAEAFLLIAITLVVTRFVARIFRRLGQPTVLGELLAGIVLGRSILGLINKDLPNQVFPPEIVPFLRVVATLGLVMFMFTVGLEVDLGAVRRSGRRAATISLTSVIVPFALGFFVLGRYLWDDHSTVNGHEVELPKFSLFVAVSLCVTAFPILARIIAERRMFQVPLGSLVITCAAIDDVVAFALLTVINIYINSADPASLPLRLAGLVAFMMALFVVIRPLMNRFVIDPWIRDRRMSADRVVIVSAGVLASAFLTSKLGLAILIGAFLFGVGMPRGKADPFFHDFIEKVASVTSTLLLPVFFVVTGLSVDIFGLGWDGIVPTLFVVLVACLGKFVGAAVAARVQGVPPRQSLAIGVLMNTRGLAELVILQIGKDSGILDDQVYTMLVIMTLVTTIGAGPLLTLVYPQRWLDKDIEEAERTKRAGPRRDRILVVAPSVERLEPVVEFAVHAGSAIRRPEIVLAGFHPATGDDSDRMYVLATTTALVGALEQVRHQLEERGIDALATVRESEDTVADTRAYAESVGPELIVADGRDLAFATSLSKGAAVDVVGIGGPALPRSSTSMVVADVTSGVALEVAARVAKAYGVPVGLVTIDGSRTPARLVRQLERFGVEHRDLGTVSVDKLIAEGDATMLVLPHTAMSELALRQDRVPVAVVWGADRERLPISERLVATEAELAQAAPDGNGQTAPDATETPGH